MERGGNRYVFPHCTKKKKTFCVEKNPAIWSKKNEREFTLFKNSNLFCNCVVFMGGAGFPNPGGRGRGWTGGRQRGSWKKKKRHGGGKPGANFPQKKGGQIHPKKRAAMPNAGAGSWTSRFGVGRGQNMGNSRRKVATGAAKFSSSGKMGTQEFGGGAREFHRNRFFRERGGGDQWRGGKKRANWRVSSFLFRPDFFGPQAGLAQNPYAGF